MRTVDQLRADLSQKVLRGGLSGLQSFVACVYEAHAGHLPVITR